MKTLPPLPQSETRRLIGMAQAGDRRALNKLTEHNVRLVMYIARRFPGRNYDELISDGLLGLTRAIQRFDLSRGTKFSSYAWPCIERAMYWKPEPFEVSMDHPLPGTDNLYMKDVMADKAPGPDVLMESGMLQQQFREVMAKKLTERENEVVILAYGFDGKEHTSPEIAQKLGLSNTRINQLMRTSHGKLAHALEDQKADLLCSEKSRSLRTRV
jgi:RNA polymerase sigma factor (sigma-70 family)